MTNSVILLNSSYAGSLLNFRGKLIEALIELGQEVHVSAPNISSQIRVKLIAIGAHVHQIRLNSRRGNPLSDVAYLYDLHALMRKIKPSLVISYTIKPNIYGSIAARLRGVRSVSMVTGLGFTFMPQKKWTSRIVKFFATRLYTIATNGNDRVIFQNPDDIRDFLAAGCLSCSNKAGLVNGSGVDLNHYGIAPLPNKPVFLMISRFLAAKGIREYVAAAQLIMGKRSDCRFILVGHSVSGLDAIPKEEIDQWCQSGIEFRGQLDDVRPAIADASVYVLPSYREGTPRSVLEAMAMGRAIITTDAPGCRETVIRGVNGCLVPVANVEKLVDAMLALADDSVLREQMGAESYRIAETKYAVDKVNRALIDYLLLKL